MLKKAVVIAAVVSNSFTPMTILAGDSKSSPKNSATVQKSNNGPLPQLLLSLEESNLLRNLFSGTIDEQEFQGVLFPDSTPFLKFLEALELRLRAGHFNGRYEKLKQLEFDGPSAAKAWLVDQSFNPLLGDFAAGLIRDESLDNVIKAQASKMNRNVEDLKRELGTISFRTAEGMSLSSQPGLGFVFNTTGSNAIVARAFALDENGRPRDYDYGLKNWQDHYEMVLEQLGSLVLAKDKSIKQRLVGYVIPLAPQLEFTVNELQKLAEIIPDLQGVLDSIRFKITLPINNTSAKNNALIDLLSEAQKLRSELLKALADLELIIDQNKDAGRQELLKEVNKRTIFFAGLRRDILRFCGQAINQMDVILELDGSVASRYMYDTPWELAFEKDRAASKAENLRDQWENIRRFNIEKEDAQLERDYEIPVTVEVKDKDGNVIRTETKMEPVHTVEELPREYETVETPQAEMKFFARIKALQARVDQLAQGGNSSQIESASREIEKLKSEFITYRQRPVVGKDEGPQKEKRTDNLLKQIELLFTQIQVVGSRASSEKMLFNRSGLSRSRSVKTALNQLEKIDGRRATIGWSVVGVTTAIGGAFACYEYLLPKGAY